MGKRLLKIKTLLLVILFCAVGGVLATLTLQRSSAKEIVLSNISADSVSVSVIRDRTLSAITLPPTIFINSNSIDKCENSAVGVPCYSEYVQTDSYAHFKLNNLASDSTYEIGWQDTLISRYLYNENPFAQFQTEVF